MTEKVYKRKPRKEWTDEDRREWAMDVAKAIEESGACKGRDHPESRFQNMFWRGPY